MTAKTIAAAAPMVTISITAAAFAEAERDRIREWVGQVKADQKARSRYLGGKARSASGPAPRACLSRTTPSEGLSAKWSRCGRRESR
jgi:hypothetical protein